MISASAVKSWPSGNISALVVEVIRTQFGQYSGLYDGVQAKAVPSVNGIVWQYSYTP